MNSISNQYFLTRLIMKNPTRSNLRFSTQVLLAAASAVMIGGVGFAVDASIIQSGIVSPTLVGDPATVPGSLTIANSSGVGTLTVNGGSDVSVSSSLFVALGTTTNLGTLNVDGAGSTFSAVTSYLGDSGPGDINISNGGTFTSTSSVFLGYFTAGNGDVDVTGANSSLSAVSLTVGRQGRGDLLISEGEVNVTSSLFVGSQVGSASNLITVDNGGHLNVSGSLATIGQNGGLGTIATTNGGFTVGNYNHSASGATAKGIQTIVSGTNNPQLNISNGSFVGNTGSDLRVGVNAGETGSITLDSSSTASELRYNNITIGDAGVGTLSVTGTSTVTNSSNFIVGNQVGSTGTVTFDGPNAQGVLENVILGNQGTGTFNVINGATVNTDDFEISELGASNGTLLVDGTGSFLNVSSSVDFGRRGTAQVTVSGNGKLKTGFSTDLGSTGFGGTADVDVLNGGIFEMGGGGLYLEGTVTDTTTLDVDSSSRVLIDITETEATSAIGTGSVIFSRDFISVGRYSTLTTNTRTVIDGSSFSAELRVSGTDARFTGEDLDIGLNNRGALQVINGGVLDLDFDELRIASGSNATGTANISNGTLIADDIELGDGANSNATMTISNGSTVQDIFRIALASFSSTGVANLTVTDSGTTVDTSNLFLGESGTANMTIANGAFVEAFDLEMGNDSASGQATLIVQGGPDGDARITSSRDFKVGRDGNSTINIFNGGIVEQNGTAEFFANATLNLVGGKFETQSISLDPSTTINFVNGEFHIENGIIFDNTFANIVLPNISSITGFGLYELTSGKHLNAGSQLFLLAPLDVKGGELSADLIVGSSLLNFETGTLNLTGPSGLTIGNTGLFGNQLHVNPGQTYNVTNSIVAQAGSRVNLAGGLLNSGAAFVNDGIVEGSGTIVAPTVAQGSAGQIRVNNNQRIIVDGGLANSGRIEVIGGEFEVTGTSNNAASTGSIIGEDATLRFNGGVTNFGSIAFSFGTSRVFGDVTNDGSIIATSNSNLTFYDDVTNNSTITVSPGTTTTFLGSYSGNGIGGGGTVFLEGDTRPGFSPGTMEFGGDLYLGEGHELVIELGGDDAADRDSLVVWGDLYLNGTLQVDLIDGYTPSAGELIEFVTANSLIGELDYTPVTFGNGLSLELVSAGTLLVVPEPVSLATFVGMMLIRRRRGCVD